MYGIAQHCAGIDVASFPLRKHNHISADLHSKTHMFYSAIFSTEPVCLCVRMYRAGLTIRRSHSHSHINVRRGPFLIRVARNFLRACSFWGVLFSPPPKKKLTFFSRRYVYTKRSNVQTFKRQDNVVKIWQLIAPTPGGGGPLPWYSRHDGKSGPAYVYLSVNQSGTTAKHMTLAILYVQTSWWTPITN